MQVEGWAPTIGCVHSAAGHEPHWRGLVPRKPRAYGDGAQGNAWTYVRHVAGAFTFVVYVPVGRLVRIVFISQDGQDWLCPDCFVDFAQAIHEGPVRPRQLCADGGYAEQMDIQARAACPGAGSARAGIRRRLVCPVRAAILATLPTDGWITFRRLA